MTQFRYLETGLNPAAYNMGLDEAVLESVSSGAERPTLRLYAWQPRAVSIGYFQGIRDEVNLERCSELGIDVVRRLTGGGAVYHADELTYSIVLPEAHPLARGSLLDSYRTLCSGVIAGMAELGVRAEFVALNDVCVGGKKVSGNAQTRRRGCVLQHGTVLLGIDPDTMFSVLMVPAEKSKGRLIADVKARVSSLADLLGRKISYDEALPAFARGFQSILGPLEAPQKPSESEDARARILARESFASDGWTFKR